MVCGCSDFLLSTPAYAGRPYLHLFQLITGNRQLLSPAEFAELRRTPNPLKGANYNHEICQERKNHVRN